MTDGSQVTAVPDTGYHFISWSDGDPGPPPVPDVIRQDVDVTGDLTATANFAINTYIVSFTAGANGSISGSTTQTVNYGADSQAITVTPDAGYTFYCTENHSKTTSTLTINNVTSAMNVIVHFLEITGDSDADGLPDGWEIDNFGNLSQNATGDNDNDELSNLIEYNNSYNPNDQNDPGLLINTITNPEDGGTL